MSEQASAFLRALWQEIHGEPPPLDAEPELLAKFLVRCLPPAPPYGAPVSQTAPEAFVVTTTDDRQDQPPGESAARAQVGWEMASPG